MKLTAQMTTNQEGKQYYALHADGKIIKRQIATKLEQSIDELDKFTVTFVGVVDVDGVLQICEV